MWINDRIIMIEDISAPPSMAGEKGQVKIIGKDIELYYAKLAVKGGHARQVETDAEIEDVLIELGLKEPPAKPVKPKRKEKAKNGTGTNS